jgi:hypothetical protein
MPKALNTNVSKLGDTMLGALTISNDDNYTQAQVRNVHISTELPNNEVGINGDLWVKVQEPVEE